MYVLSISNATNDIVRILPCSLKTWYDQYSKLDDSDVTYQWIDHSAFSKDSDVGEFLSRPSLYAFLEGRNPSDNKLIRKEIATAQTQAVTVPANGSYVDIRIPVGMKYLGINALVAAGGAGSSSMYGGCGASVRNVVVDIDGANTIRISKGAPGTPTDPNGYATELLVDGNSIYRLSGGVGGSDTDISAPAHAYDLYDPIAGSGGFWQISLGGPTFNGNSRTTQGPIGGYGGGGDYNQPGQPAYVDMFFSDIRPNIDGPVLSNRRIPYTYKQFTSYSGSPVTVPTGTSTATVTKDLPYLCVISACAGGGYGSDTVPGGQGASMGVTWWAMYPGQTVTFTVGKGGDVSGSSTGGQTTITTTDGNGQTRPLLILNGGKTDGTGGNYTLGYGTNMFVGKNKSSRSPIGVTGNFGNGGTNGKPGADGTLIYTFCSAPPAGTTIYDSLEDPLYDQTAQ